MDTFPSLMGLMVARKPKAVKEAKEPPEEHPKAGRLWVGGRRL